MSSYILVLKAFVIWSLCRSWIGLSPLTPHPYPHPPPANSQISNALCTPGIPLTHLLAHISGPGCSCCPNALHQDSPKFTFKSLPWTYCYKTTLDFTAYPDIFSLPAGHPHVKLSAQYCDQWMTSLRLLPDWSSAQWGSCLILSGTPRSIGALLHRTERQYFVTGA